MRGKMRRKKDVKERKCEGGEKRKRKKENFVAPSQFPSFANADHMFKAMRFLRISKGFLLQTIGFCQRCTLRLCTVAAKI